MTARKRTMTEIKREKDGKWKKGQSGNPSGGRSKAAQVLDGVLIDRLSSIMDVMIEKALDGDTTAAKIVLDRFIPTLKQTEQNTKITADVAVSGISKDFVNDIINDVNSK